MKRKLAIVLLGLASLPAFAVNFSGKWAIQTPSGRGGGRGGPTVLTLNQVGNEVTGTIGSGFGAASGSPVNTELLGGKVEGDVVSFYVWTGSDQPAKVTYQGKMSPSGEEIEFTVTGGRGGGGTGGQGPGQPGGRGGTAGVQPAGQTGAAATTGRGQPAGPQQVTAKRTP
jgi:hypothetical protein